MEVCHKSQGAYGHIPGLAIPHFEQHMLIIPMNGIPKL